MRESKRAGESERVCVCVQYVCACEREREMCSI